MNVPVWFGESGGEGVWREREEGEMEEDDGEGGEVEGWAWCGRHREGSERKKNPNE